MGTPLSAKNFFSQDLRKKGPVESFPNFSKNLLLKPIQAYNLVEFFKILQPPKKYEFGSKVSLATLPGNNVVVGVENFCGNPPDSKTLSVTLDSIYRMFGKEFSSVLVDRGYKGHGQVGSSEVILAGSCQGKSGSSRRHHKKRCRGRSAIEAIIGHLKSEHRLSRNSLKGRVGDSMNALLAAIGFNLSLLLA